MAEVLGVVASTVSILNLLKAVRLAQPAYDIVLSFRPLQKERIEALQQELLDLIKKRQDLIKDHEDLKRVNELIDATLHVYGDALRDYETLSQESVPDLLPKPKLLSLPFSRVFAQKKYHLWRAAMLEREQLAKQVEWSTQRYFFRELNREFRLESERTQAYWERLWMGVFGGIALIGPMLLMVLHHDLNTSVITVSVATALFTLVLAIAGRDWGGKDVLAATAAYAAVLVVFVGASMTPMT